MRLLGIDYGRKRVGLALSDETGRFAFPHSVLSSDKYLLKNILEICQKEGVGKIVLGQSLNYRGEPNPIMSKIGKLKRAIETIGPLEVILEPEFLTSKEAERLQGQNEMHDASAAALILKSYIDRTNHAHLA